MKYLKPTEIFLLLATSYIIWHHLYMIHKKHMTSHINPSSPLNTITLLLSALIFKPLFLHSYSTKYPTITCISSSNSLHKTKSSAWEAFPFSLLLQKSHPHPLNPHFYFLHYCIHIHIEKTRGHSPCLPNIQTNFFSKQSSTESIPSSPSPFSLLSLLHTYTHWKDKGARCNHAGRMRRPNGPGKWIKWKIVIYKTGRFGSGRGWCMRDLKGAFWGSL